MIHVFCDFDGTISTADIGLDLFARFSVIEPFLTQYLQQRITVRQYWQALLRNLQQPFTARVLDDYLRGIPIDPGFAELHGFLLSSGIPFTVVSDGLDLYVNGFLRINGFSQVQVVSNTMQTLADGTYGFATDYAAENCQCAYRSVVCKRNVTVTMAHPDARIVYVGDGSSDFCPAQYADVVFAKGPLAAFCNANRIPHYPFKTLADVARQLRLLLSAKRIRPRHQAVLKRKALWEGE